MHTNQFILRYCFCNTFKMHTCWEKLLVRGTMWSNFLPKLLMELLFSFFFHFPLFFFKHEASLLERFIEKKGFVPGNFCEKCDLLVGKLPLIWEG